MTNRITHLTPAADIAATIFDAYYTDLRDAAALTAYIDESDDADTSRSIRDRLIDALADDIHDMLHNANLDLIIPDPPDDDDAYAALSDRIDTDDDITALLASLILA